MLDFKIGPESRTNYPHVTKEEGLIFEDGDVRALCHSLCGLNARMNGCSIKFVIAQDHYDRHSRADISGNKLHRHLDDVGNVTRADADICLGNIKVMASKVRIIDMHVADDPSLYGFSSL